MKRKPTRRKSIRRRPALFAMIVFVLIASLVAYQVTRKKKVDTPSHFSISVSSNMVGSQSKFSVLWLNDVNVSGYVFGSNTTGTFVNDTWIPFPSSVDPKSAFANVTITLNNTVGNTVQWVVWCNDTYNSWTSIDPQYVLCSERIVLLMTIKGNITIELYDDMPITTNNFKNLVRKGVYNGTIFHRVIDGFVIQGGDPTGTGYGDPSIPAIKDEFTDHNRNYRGTIAMANAGPDTGSSQFFINLVDNNSLDGKHPVFGRVVAGMDVVDKIGKVETYKNDPTIDPNDPKKDRPKQDVTIIKAQLIP